jgi:hypothetical protein
MASGFRRESSRWLLFACLPVFTNLRSGDNNSFRCAEGSHGSTLALPLARGSRRPSRSPWVLIVTPVEEGRGRYVPARRRQRSGDG